MKYIKKIYKAFLCEVCEQEVGNLEGWPYYKDSDGNYYCPDCALKKGLCNADEWLQDRGIRCYDHAVYADGKIIAYQKWGKGYRKDVVEIG